MCRGLGSSLYAHLLERAAADVEAAGPCWEVLRECQGDPIGTVVGLRFMAAVHRLVLRGEAPALAAHYRSRGGRVGGDVWLSFRTTVSERADDLRALVQRPVQTNEVARAAALLGGFLSVARDTELSLRALEIGASAGLNLRWDRFRYEVAEGGGGWGDPGSPVLLRGVFDGAPPPLEVRARVAERRGCDAEPLDPASPADVETLLACTWADQVERFRLLEAALAAAADHPAAVDRAPAAAWLEERLAAPREGVATVVYQSLVLQYLDDAERAAVTRAMEAAGERACAAAPLAWLRMEPGGELADVRLRTWPGGEDRLVARAGYHGRPVRWMG